MIVRASRTPKLGLFKWDIEQDGNEDFDIEKSMNDNWDKIDANIEEVELKLNDIETLKTDNITIKTDISNIKNEQATQNTNISELQADNETNKTDIVNIKNEQTTQSSNITVLQTDNETNKTDIIDIKQQLEDIGSGGGSTEGGTTNYNQLTNKPQINSIELSGNKTLDDLDIASKASVTAVETELGNINSILDNINGEVITNVNSE